MTVVIHSATKVDADGQLEDFWVAFTGTTIAAAGVGNGWHGWSTAANAEVINARGRWLTPGFIDVHSHGGGGHAFDRDADGITAALAAHRAHGTTRSIVSLVSNTRESLTTNLALIATLAESDPLVLGSHLEGPYLALSRRGAHNPEFLKAPDRDEVRDLVDAARGSLRQVTIAPELPGALEIIDQLVDADVVVAIGHTEADFDLAREAFDRGASLLTHGFEAMPGIGHREPGPVTAALVDPRVALELVLDGVQVHPEVARIAFYAAPQRIVLVTDAMSAPGSSLTQDAALRSAIFDSGVDPVLAVRAVTASPARALKLDETLGYLAPGFAADAVLLDAGWNVEQVWAAGSRV
ncbi:amidohydrolase family protein [Subtercola sp. PAMC28395]|uniref:N-acetylglucosamine-6-phosphate deacetylase n=1 Tax=Subtercola sp. PAMC28395 TaxID=2846775 RepID=UPI001C0C676A|nr:amidohydrolase family protein [Subtercola sp. PAMC28395]QWT23975.1 amidohydrolase family protein [Subtercola sp. PAMC28395]